MNFSVKKLNKVIFCFISLLVISRPALSIDLNPDEMKEVLKISKNISLAKSSLPDSKKLEYALGIFKASKTFNIPSNLLIAIASQETSFREDLPEGKAGEFGITQIRKIWIANPKLRKNFRLAKVKDLMNPEKAFLYAAWILKDLKEHAPKSSIPFWSFYNAKGFKPRFKYFLAVNQKISYLNRGVPFSREIEENIQINGSTSEKSWRPDLRLLATATPNQTETAPTKKTELTKAENNLITTASLNTGIAIEPNGWIAQALKRLQHQPVGSNASNLIVPIELPKTEKPNKIAFSKAAQKLLKAIQD
jgi:hypothetical protein